MVMALDPDISTNSLPACRLEPFDPAYADTVITWVRDEREAFWLAPRNRPPLTADQVLGWQTEGHRAFMLVRPGQMAPVAYGELNDLSGSPRRFWLGHLVVDPAERGRGYGIQLTRLLVWHAFSRCGARDVTLVVFPENRRAIASYRTAGLRDDGWETHTFPAYGRTARLLRMTAKGYA
jgi:ribosomal protein S18 acetylase RimI-like enzyme